MWEGPPCNIWRQTMSSFFVVPTFVPPTLEQLVKEPDEVAIIVAQEAKIAQEVTMIATMQAHGQRAPCAHPITPGDHSRPSALLLQLAAVREHNRDTEPLGVIAAQEELESEQDEGLTSDGGGSRGRRLDCSPPLPFVCQRASLLPTCRADFTEEEGEEDEEEDEEELDQADASDIEDDDGAALAALQCLCMLTDGIAPRTRNLLVGACRRRRHVTCLPPSPGSEPGHRWFSRRGRAMAGKVEQPVCLALPWLC